MKLHREISMRNPLIVRHNRRWCRRAAARPGARLRQFGRGKRMRALEIWQLNQWVKAKPYGQYDTITPLEHVLPLHLFTLAERLEATRWRAKGKSR